MHLMRETHERHTFRQNRRLGYIARAHKKKPLSVCGPLGTTLFAWNKLRQWKASCQFLLLALIRRFSDFLYLAPQLVTTLTLGE